MSRKIQGAFHFHSTYSHDGRSSLGEVAAALKAQGLTFCVMTDHFEDFDAAKFSQYLKEMQELTQSSGVTFIPGAEVHLSGVDTLVFPVRSYEQVVALESGEAQDSLFKVVAHPSRYGREQVLNHLSRYRIDGIELWNQQADGCFLPPLELFAFIASSAAAQSSRYFFGCDIHDAKLAVANLLEIEDVAERTPDAIASALMSGSFVARNRNTAVELRNGERATELVPWLEALRKRSFRRGQLLRGIRRCLRRAYKSLPRQTQRSLNDVKNAVRNRI